MSQKINLNRYLKDATEAEKTLFAELAVETINSRTLDGDTIHGGSFKRYSPEYADKKGVSRDSVDLFLEGDMLDSVEAFPEDKFLNIRIGGDSVETAKGYNHQVGDTLPKRPWFGLTTTEAREIANQIKSRRTQQTTTLADIRSALALLGIEQDE